MYKIVTLWVWLRSALIWGTSVYVDICLGQCGQAEVQCGINVHTLSKIIHPVSWPVHHCSGNCWPRALPPSLWILLFIPWPVHTSSLSLSLTHYCFPDLFIYKLSHFYFQFSSSLLCLFSTPISQYVFLSSSLLTFCIFLSLSFFLLYLSWHSFIYKLGVAD